MGVTSGGKYVATCNCHLDSEANILPHLFKNMIILIKSLIGQYMGQSVLLSLTFVPLTLTLTGIARNLSSNLRDHCDYAGRLWA